jgi:hypothetical protein
LLLIASGGSIDCYSVTPYRPALDPKTAAKFVPIQAQDKDVGGLLFVDVYTFDKGCPEVDTRLRASGYQGSVDLRAGDPFAVIGNEPVALQFGWNNNARFCRSLLVVRPTSGITYGYVYTAPEPGSLTCGSAILRIVENQSQKPHLKRIDNVTHVPQTVKATESPEENLAGYESTQTKDSTGPSVNTRLCSLAHIPAAVDAPESTPTEKSAAASAPVPNALAVAAPPLSGDSTVLASPDSATPAAPTVTPAPAAPTPIVASRPRAPIKPQRPSGSGIYLGFGLIGGGKDLAQAQDSNGNEYAVSAGGGVAGHVGVRLTPVWLKDRFGLGLGADVGVKSQSIDAVNGSVSFLRVPFVMAAHLLIQADRHWFFLLRGGLHKDLSAHLSGTGDTSVDVYFNTHLAAMGEAGALYAITPNVGFDVTFRVTGGHYNFGRAQIDATNAGLFGGMHLMY